MSEPRKTTGSIRFGPFDLSPESSELRKHGQRLKLSGQAIDVLLMLASNPGSLVTREDLQRRLWPGDSFGDFEHGLNAAVNRLRETLGDSATDPTYIETVPRRGYRFIAQVGRVLNTADPAESDNAGELHYQRAADIQVNLKQLKRATDSSSTHTSSGAASASSSAAVSSPQERPSSGAVLLAEARRHKQALALVLVVLVAWIAGLGIYLSRLNERRNDWNLQARKISRVTQSGNATNVAISPDGRYVVYVLREGEKQSLNVRQIATGSDVQILPPEEVVIFSLTFSPDANYVDFISAEKPDFTDTHLYRMPVLGGTPHLVMHGGVDFGSSYSPDGTEFAFLRVGASEKLEVWIAKADGSDQRLLASPPYIEEETGVAWSPDGKTIAYTASDTTKGLRSGLWAISVAEGSVRKIYSTPGDIGRPRWLPDGSGVLAAIANAGQTSRGQIWFISYPRGQARRLTNDLMDYQLCCLDLTPDGKTLVDTELSTVSDLWLAPGEDTAKAKQITTKEFPVEGFSWMPDGRIIFAGRDGNLYTVNHDGSGRTRLTSDNSPGWDPSVCGDGRYIVYAGDRERKSGIWRISSDGSNPLLIAGEALAVGPQCSPDGKWVVYLRGPSWTPVRVPTTGAKPPQVIAQDFGFEIDSGYPLRISPDGKRIMYLASPKSPENSSSPSASTPFQLKAIPSDGGADLYNFDWPASANAPRWAPAGDSVEYALTKSGVSNIWQQRLEGGPPKQITHFQSGLIFDFDWWRTGRQLALIRGSKSSDVVLISNFR
jgi:Tol biopolymer transport system component/DNA-binding winged helix-turn-helix (wHTH) protein